MIDTPSALAPSIDVTISSASVFWYALKIKAPSEPVLAALNSESPRVNTKQPFCIFNQAAFVGAMSRPSACIDSNKNDLSASTSLAAAFLSTKRIDQVTYLWLSPDKTYLYDTKLSLLTPAFLAAAQAASSALFKASIVISSFFKFLNSSLKMNNVSATRTASTKPARSYFFHI